MARNSCRERLKEGFGPQRPIQTGKYPCHDVPAFYDNGATQLALWRHTYGFAAHTSTRDRCGGVRSVLACVMCVAFCPVGHWSAKKIEFRKRGDCVLKSRVLSVNAGVQMCNAKRWLLLTGSLAALYARPEPAGP